MKATERFDVSVNISNIGLHRHISTPPSNTGQPQGVVMRREVRITVNKMAVRIQAGCFSGTVDEFRKRIASTYRAGKYGSYSQFHPNVVRKARKEYLAVADFAATLQKTWCKKARRKSK